MQSKPKSSRFHFLEPDYKRPVFKLPGIYKKRIIEKLTFLYGEKDAKGIFPELERVMKVYYAHKKAQMIEWEKNSNPADRFTEKDVIFISYGDLIKDGGHKPLETDIELSKKYLKGIFSILHILPFFPYSSDRGFAIMDFEEVDPHLGSWEDIARLKEDFRLMFDGVINHISSKSHWFQEFLNQNPEFLNFFTVFSTTKGISKEHLRLLVRPRASDILTSFNTLNGKRWVWTTFSPDQIDLNYRNPEVLIRMIQILLFYVRHEADIIRLDAVTYLWDELGTTGAHLEQTHVIIKLFRDVLDAVAPHVALITETNVPHEKNIQYFGNGTDEAQMVYNFALPPLVLHAFQNNNAAKLTGWASGLQQISDTATYLNFLDSHDGIGVMGAVNILNDEEIEKMELKVLEHGGFISYTAGLNGVMVPYEFNITWYSAINREDSDESEDIQVKRYLASRSIALVLLGVPGVYIHGLLGSKNDVEAVIEERQTRSINRRVIKKKELIRALQNPNTTTYKVASQFIKMIRIRTHEIAFHPNAPQKVLNISNVFFTVLRTSLNGKSHILAVTNVTPNKQDLRFDMKKAGLSFEKWYDLLSRKFVTAPAGEFSFSMQPYDVLWLKTG